MSTENILLPRYDMEARDVSWPRRKYRAVVWPHGQGSAGTMRSLKIVYGRTERQCREKADKVMQREMRKRVKRWRAL